MRLVILGGSGAGKGTQAQMLCSQLNIPCVSTGDILLEAIRSCEIPLAANPSQGELGCQAQPYVEKGELVPDTIMIQFIRMRLNQPDVTKGWLLDGYPRTAFQAEELDFLLDELEQKLNWAIWLDVSDSVMLSRSIERGRSLPEGLSRLDDQPEIIQRRIALFRERTIPILDYYEQRQRLLTINGNQPPEKVQQDIWQKLF